LRFTIVFSAGLAAFFLGIVSPAFTWMKNGYFPNYDFFALLGWKNPTHITDWIGVNDFLNGIMSVNIFVGWLILVGIIIFFMD
jgi:hypothetical protein